MTYVHISSGLVLHQMASAENNTSGPASFFIKWRLLKIKLQAPFLNVQMMSDHNSSDLAPQRQMTYVHISSGLVLHQMTSDHNRSELGILVNSNEPSTSKLVPKVVPLAVKTATSRKELELLFHHHIAMLRTTSKYIYKYKIRKTENFQKDSSRHVSWNRQHLRA
ncbi:hypothetical protein Tco_0063522 [Tanacetum coccineum]